jgi:hypothetical protein
LGENPVAVVGHLGMVLVAITHEGYPKLRTLRGCILSKGRKICGKENRKYQNGKLKLFHGINGFNL